MQDPRDGAEVRPKSRRYDDGFALTYIVDAPVKRLLHYPPIGSGDLAEYAVCFGGDCEFEHRL